jgi:hypothetical protein
MTLYKRQEVNFMETVLVTPSYAPDFERCRMLCESVEKYVISCKKHIIIVDNCDLKLFLQLKSNRIEIVSKESMLPRWIKKAPFFKKWWISIKALPVRGWILQQVIKLSVAEFIDADIYIFADSDVVFVRPFDLSNIIKDGKVRLFRTPIKPRDYKEPRHQNWYRHAGSLFGIKGDTYLKSDYISQLNSWRRDVLVQLYQHISQISKRHWKEELLRTFDFSEYTLYGIFAEFVLNNNAAHYWDKNEICLCSWHHTVEHGNSIDSFLNHLHPEHVAILIQSNLNMNPQDYRQYIKKLQHRINK